MNNHVWHTICDYIYKQTKKRNDNKNIFYTEVILALIVINGEEHIYAVTRDITDRKLLENTIKQNNNHMNFVSKNANLGFWNFNPQIGDLFVDDIFVAMLGYNPEKVLKAGYHAEMFKPFKDGLAFWEQLLHPDDVERTTKVLMAHINGETDLYKVDYRMRRADGSWMWSTAIGKIAEYDEDGKPIRFNGVNLDIDDAKEAQNALKESQEFVQTLMDSQEQLIITTNGITMTSANQTFSDFYNVKNVEEFKASYDLACICETFNINAPKDYLQIKMGDEDWIDYVIARSESSYTHKAMISRNDVDYIFSVSAAILPGEDGLKSAVFTDITEMENAKQEVEASHKHTREAIEYASLIQGAIVPEHKDMQSFFKDSFVHWIPKDTVGGDIWLFSELRHKDECLLLFIDCTGHGVPGALVTMIVKSIEREIVSKIKADRYNDIDVSPAWIMSYFNKTTKELLKQETKNSVSNAGWDGGVIYYNRRTQVLKFAGAETPLFYIDENQEFQTIKGNRYSVGYKKCVAEYVYKETIIDVKEGMKFYCTTDGYLDQNGGEKGFPFGKKRFSNIIKENHTQGMSELKNIFIQEMDSYESMVEDNDRNDDITLMAFEIDHASNITEETIQEIVKYEGLITQNVIATAMDNIETKVTNLGMLGIISTITIECCQNMMHYSKDKKVGSREILSEGQIEVQYINDEYYNIITTNIVSIEDKEKIELKLSEIQSLDKASIKKRYRELRKSGENSHEKGGGIGMYEIAKISDGIGCEFKAINEFHAINEDKFYFTMTATVKPKKRSSEE